VTGGSSPALEAFAVGKRYARRRPPALDGVDLAIPTGTITALVGPNGAGKSTLIKAWVGFERPTSGRVTVAGIDPFRDRGAALARLAYIPQMPALYRELTVAEHLDLAGILRDGFDRALAARRLDDLSIPQDVLAAHLSGGQQAQVGLALALGTRAETLLLDEPLAALDPLARREFLYILEAHVREHGTTALMSSHVITDVERTCDRLVVLGGGRKLLDEAIEPAVAAHRVAPGGSVVPDGCRAVASFLDLDGAILTLIEVAPDRPAGDGLRPATLEELVLGYLAAGRPGMVERVKAGVAGR
jgi:ABC-2 type transport system ATP-binding protein